MGKYLTVEVRMQKLLDEILLSENVVEQFYKHYGEEKFREWILSVLPEVKDCKNLKQDNPWHIYNCLDHILHSVEEINKQSKNLPYGVRRLLAYVMFFHDIGKPKCHIRRYSKLYGREVDSFFNHNLESVLIAERVLSYFDFTKKEQELIKLLVHEHDIFMSITLCDDGNKYHKVLSQKLIDEYIKNYGYLMDGKLVMRYLTMVGRADNLAQNPALTKEPLHLLDVIDNMISDEKDNAKKQNYIRL